MYWLMKLIFMLSCHASSYVACNCFERASGDSKPTDLLRRSAVSDLRLLMLVPELLRDLCKVKVVIKQEFI